MNTHTEPMTLEALAEKLRTLDLAVTHLYQAVAWSKPLANTISKLEDRIDRLEDQAATWEDIAELRRLIGRSRSE